ncbi:hypothetical protein [Streptomyces sp. WZ-12]|uniref:hypothetical protein n=1 Tax=Streptomyces sp. WZ-12 TaxID=3030210 RepID=UPI002381872B|nr:hypothetical protein [Streptomyces sp. WZ-12]
MGSPIADPVGWLIGRAPPRRQDCAEPPCDDGVLLGVGRDCPRCESRQLDRRAQRSVVAAAVDAALPGVSEAERRVAVAVIVVGEVGDRLRRRFFPRLRTS